MTMFRKIKSMGLKSGAGQMAESLKAQTALGKDRSRLGTTGRQLKIPPVAPPVTRPLASTGTCTHLNIPHTDRQTDRPLQAPAIT